MKTPRENFTDLVKGKSVLFLENQMDLADQPRLLRGWAEGVADFVTTIENLRSFSKAFVEDMLNIHDVLIFETTWTFDNTRILREYILSEMKRPLHIIECYRGKDPTLFYKPTGCIHEIYIFKDYRGVGIISERFCKLSFEPYWNYINQFDQ